MFAQKFLLSTVALACSMSVMAESITDKYSAATVAHPAVAAARSDLESAKQKADAVRAEAWTPELSLNALVGWQYAFYWISWV